MIKYADYKKFDVVNGPGVRHSLFISGCTHHCKGCFNKKLWDFNYGKPFDDGVQDTIIEDVKDDKISGLSILGGEPFDNVDGLLPFIIRYKKECGKNLWVWSGYTYEQILKDKNKSKMLEYTDVLVDGKFDESLKDLNLKFRGSSNQRIIKLQ